MALMSEERRKEMEEEMNRFELEIAAPGANKPIVNDTLIANKPLSPPPAPPAVSLLIPEVLAKAPPPPPPSTSPPLHVVLRPPPPPPSVPVPVRPQGGSVRFIPHQIQRQPPRPPPMRGSFVPIRGIPIEGPPAPFPPPGMMGPFVPNMGQAQPVVEHHIPGPPMHPMGPGHMPLMHGPVLLPHQIGNMNVMPPGFCHPPRPGHVMMPVSIPCDAQTFIRNNEGAQDFVPVSTSASTSEPNSVVVAAPAIYASPFVKSQSENISDMLTSTNGQDNLNISIGIGNAQKLEKYSTRHEEHVVGPAVPSIINHEETVVVSKKKEKKKKSVRMAGGQAWEDNSLLEWDPDDFRIFCGDLGNDVTDEVLIRAFSKYTSFVKAKVIRDKRTNKTKGYGFVSFKDPQDFIKAMREMNGKYVGSRPIKLRKSTWKDRNIDLVKKKQREKEKLGLL